MAVDSVKSNESSQTAHATGFRSEFIELVLPKVVWVLQAYQKKGDAFVEEWPLRGISLSMLHDLFQQPQDDPMYDAYPVGEAQAERLQAYTDHTIDLQAYDYFVECYAE